MCTFLLAWRVFPDTPIVVAANRDERYDRPSTPPTATGTDPTIVAPRDEDAGGTWIGYNEHGVVASVTNRWTDTKLRGERSRGLLVTDVLDDDGAEAAVRTVEHLVADHEYAGFNLVIADSVGAFLLEWDGALTVTRFDPGVHVVVNVGADDRFAIPTTRDEAAQQQATNARRARSALQPQPGERAAAWVDRAVDVLRDHEYGFCVHRDGFGTRSSSLITVDDTGTVTYRFADGPPCERTYEVIDTAIDVDPPA